MNLSKYHIYILEDLLNEEILSYLESGYSLEDEYIIGIKEIMKILNIKEKYNFDKFRGE
jgi:hypothetical protein